MKKSSKEAIFYSIYTSVSYKDDYMTPHIC